MQFSAVTREVGRIGRRSANKFSFAINAAILLSFVIGAAVGSVKANNAPFQDISRNLNLYISGITGIEYGKAQTFAECMVKYGKSVLIMWFLTFMPPAGFISPLIIFAKGMGLGFTTALFVRSFGLNGIFFASVLYLPQNLALIPVYFFVARDSLNIALGEARAGANFFGIKISGPLENGVPLFIGISCVFIASIIEIFAVPWLAAVFIG